jgi:hypothetical protein
MINLNKGLASVAVCALGAVSLYLTHGQCGMGWTILGLYIIWF